MKKKDKKYPNSSLSNKVIHYQIYRTLKERRKEKEKKKINQIIIFFKKIYKKYEISSINVIDYIIIN